MPPTNATGSPALSTRAVELLDHVRAEPGARTAAEWARHLGWDERLTQEAASELEASGEVLDRSGCHLRPGVFSLGEPPTWAYRRLPARSQRQRSLVMAWVDGCRTVPDLAAVLGVSEEAVRQGWGRLTRDGWAWRLGTLVDAGQAFVSESHAGNRAS